MKHKLVSSDMISMFAALAAVALLAGCAGVEATNTKSLLSAAGFHVRTPQTPLQKEIYAQLTNHKVARITYKGKTAYVFKDESEGNAYVGREQEYQRYQQLCIQQRIAQDYYMAYQMNNAYAYRYYGAWGYRGWY